MQQQEPRLKIQPQVPLPRSVKPPVRRGPSRQSQQAKSQSSWQERRRFQRCHRIRLRIRQWVHPMQPQEHLRELKHLARRRSSEHLNRENRHPESSLIPHQKEDLGRMLMSCHHPAG